ncbi:MAG: pitrilysin family protein [Candidatus Sumerlaeota bacterium]|nr:pitrilysin family protein [Candidatus Sumerlaeota bacterium]
MSASSTLDDTDISLTTLKEKLREALDIYADVILHPTFPETEFKRVQQERLARIQQEKSRPSEAALRVLPKLLYGEGHAYSNPLTGTGTEASVAKLTSQDLGKFHDAWFKPNHATLIVVGDTTLEEIQPRLEELFSSWKPGDIPEKRIGEAHNPEKAAVYVIDKPNSPQSTIYAGLLAPPKNNPREIAIVAMNSILGGMFTSRINMNLREDKHWTYGARSGLQPARAQRPFYVSTSVQIDKTAESMQEIENELQGILGKKPVTEEELAKARDAMTQRLAGQWETIDAVAGSIATLVRYGLPDDYYETYPANVRALTRQDVEDAAKTVVEPNRLVWVVVGDRKKMEAEVKEKGFTNVTVLDADGNVVK